MAQFQVSLEELIYRIGKLTLEKELILQQHDREREAWHVERQELEHLLETNNVERPEWRDGLPVHEVTVDKWAQLVRLQTGEKRREEQG